MSLKDRISNLDSKGESGVLLDAKVEDLHCFTEELFSLVRVNTSISWKQSRMQWLREGDANSKKFHGIMSTRKRRNATPFFLVNGVLVEGVDNVRGVVFSHFSNHFQGVSVDRTTVEALNFRKLNHREGVGLIKPFSMEEVKAAVWDCDNYTCPGHNGISFGFIKKIGKF